MFTKRSLLTTGILFVGLASACVGSDDPVGSTRAGGATLQLTVEATVFVEPTTVAPEPTSTSEPTLTPTGVSAQDELPPATTEPTAIVVLSSTVPPTATPRLSYYTRPTPNPTMASLLATIEAKIATPTPDSSTVPDLMSIATPTPATNLITPPPTPRPTVTPTALPEPTSTPTQVPEVPTATPEPENFDPILLIEFFDAPTGIGDSLEIILAGASNTGADWSNFQIMDIDFVEDPGLSISNVEWVGTGQLGATVTIVRTANSGASGPHSLMYLGFSQ